MGVNDPQVLGEYLFSFFIHLKAVRDDLFHWLDRLSRTVPSGHLVKSKLTFQLSTVKVVNLSCLLQSFVLFATAKCLSTHMCSSLWHCCRRLLQ